MDRSAWVDFCLLFVFCMASPFLEHVFASCVWGCVFVRDIKRGKGSAVAMGPMDPLANARFFSAHAFPLFLWFGGFFFCLSVFTRRTGTAIFAEQCPVGDRE